jgi:phage-related baseplate assembly protein
MTEPDFIKITQADIVSSFVKNYEQAYFNLTGNTVTVQPAQAEMLLIEAGAHEIYLHALRVQSAAVQNLAQFATYPQLDLLAEPFGVSRLPAQPSLCIAGFVLNGGHGDLVIPAGTRIQSDDGIATFFTVKPIPVLADVNYIQAPLVCDTPGTVGDGYAIGKIKEILDPQPYLASVTNIDITAGGSNAESDAGLRARLFLSSNAFSVAGPADAYKFLAKSASPLVLDVGINNGGGGLVNIYPLVAGGTTPTEILNAVNTACSPKDKRPTSDTVSVISPTALNYTVDIDLIVYGTVADPAALVSEAVAKVRAVTDRNASKLGVDAIVSQLIAAASLQGVYKVIVNSPLADVVVSETQVAICAALDITLAGFNNDL